MSGPVDRRACHACGRRSAGARGSGAAPGARGGIGTFIVKATKTAT